MNEKIDADIKILKFIYNKNKPFILPAAIMLISVILFFQFVIPQFRELLTARKEVAAASQKLKTLKANLDVLSNVNEETLDSQLKILNLALPLNKDFIGILDSIYSTVQKIGVDLGVFSFKVGDLSESKSDGDFPVVKLSLPINSGIIATNSFVEAMSKTFPLSEVYFIKVGNMFSTVNVSFYYEPLGGSGYKLDAPISPISQKGITLVNQLRGFENEFSFSKPLVATSSASQ